MQTEDQVKIKTALTAVLALLFFRLCVHTPLSRVIRNTFGSTNLPAMALSVLFFLLVFFLLRKTVPAFPKRAVFPVFAGAGIFLLISYFREGEMLSGDTAKGIELRVPPYVYIPGILLTSLLIIFGVRAAALRKADTEESGLKNTAASGILFTAAAVLLIGLSAYHQYCLNFSKYNDFYHLNAYINSIFNVFWGQPFTDTVSSVYGHYAFFYLPVLRLARAFGYHDYYKVYMMISSLLTVLTLVIWLFILKWNVKKDVYRILGLFVICSFNASRLFIIYHQVFPHRVFPMSLMMLLIALWYRGPAEKRMPLTVSGYVLCAFMMVWNVESGVIAVISWTALHCCSAIQERGKAPWVRAVLYCLLIPLTFFAALLLCGWFNILAGGRMLSLREFLFPLLDPDYMTGILELELPAFPSSWMSITVLFLMFLGYGLKDTCIYSAECGRSDLTAACFAASVLGLGGLTYGINRPAYGNFYMILPLAGLLIAILAENLAGDRDDLFRLPPEKTDLSRTVKGCGGLLSFCVLCLLTLGTLINIPYKLKEFSRYKNFAPIFDLVQVVNSKNDEDAYALGCGASTLFTVIGRDPGLHFMDVADLTEFEKARQEAVDVMKTLDTRAVFISRDVTDLFTAEDGLLPDEFYESHILDSDLRAEDLIIWYYVPRTSQAEPEK